MSVRKARKLFAWGILIASVTWAGVSLAGRPGDGNRPAPFACGNCDAEEQAVLIADDNLDAAEDALDLARDLYEDCTADCDDEEAALLMAADVRDAARDALDLALMLLEECENGPVPPEPSQYVENNDDGLHSVLVRR